MRNCAGALLKNRNLLKDEKFKKMYVLDRENRTALLTEIKSRKALLNAKAGEKKEGVEIMNQSLIKQRIPSFMEILNPINGSTEETLRIIKEKISEAKFEFDIFSRIERFPNGKNQYGLNGCIAAAIDFFYQLGYFKNEYTLEQILKAQ